MATEVTGLVERFLRHTALERGRSANTVSAYRRDLERWAARLGARPIGSVSATDITDHLASLRAEGLA